MIFSKHTKTIFLLAVFYIFSSGCASQNKITSIYRSPKLSAIDDIAVTPFKDAPGILAKGSGATVTDVIVTQLLTVGKYRVIERTQIERILKEQGYWLSGIFDESTAKQVGKLAGAQAIVMGAVTEYELRKGHIPLYYTNIPTRSYTVGLSIRVVDVETGEILYSSSATGEGNSYAQAADNACKFALQNLH